MGVDRTFVANFELQYGKEVTLIAVSKTQPAERIREAYSAGIRHVGENYLQEALSKQTELEDLDLVWHFIGPLQSNKTKAIAEQFDWVHSIDRLKLAERLSAQRPKECVPLNVLIQVNVSGEESKSGVSPDALAPLAKAIQALPYLKLRGLMAIPEPTEDEERLRSRFRMLATLRQELNASMDMELDTLSMGMSADYALAIEEGATQVRLGTAIFGARPQKHVENDR